MRVLVAEDDAVSRRVLVAVLSSHGHDVEATTTGDEAWAALEGRGSPVLAILDWMMPGLDGPELCRRIRANPLLRGSYVILLTARAQQDDIVQGLDAGADDYLTKPFDAPELLARVRAGERILGLQGELRDRVGELERAIAAVKTLQGLLPICCYCKRIRQDGDYWSQVEDYVAQHSHAEFTHGICPECLALQFGERVVG